MKSRRGKSGSWSSGKGLVHYRHRRVVVAGPSDTAGECREEGACSEYLPILEALMCLHPRPIDAIPPETARVA
ncbi:MAG TPA: hypothetical protein VFB58_12440, partial [Chloroflexota bacterium]|nr:hypothetical protein [Chloroflexota bacterium]